jgi:hypothetical protein
VSGYKKLEVKTLSGYYIRGILPGWGQIYAGNTTRGIIIAGTFSIALSLTIWSGIQYNKAKSAYDDLGPSDSNQVYKEKRDSYASASRTSYIFIGITSALYVINWVDLLFFNKIEFNNAGEQNNRLYYSFNYENKTQYVKEQRATAHIGIWF